MRDLSVSHVFPLLARWTIDMPWKDPVRSLITRLYYYSGACQFSTVVAPSFSMVTIVYFHEILDCMVPGFRRIIGFLRDNYQFVGLSEGVQLIAAGSPVQR